MAIVGRDVNHWKINTRSLKAVSDLDAGFVVQIDIEDHANSPIEIIVILEGRS